MSIQTKNKLHTGDLLSEFSDINVVKEALAECLVDGDLEGFQDIFAAFIDSINKNEFSKKTSISRNTLYRIKDKENLTIEKAFEILNAAS